MSAERVPCAGCEDTVTCADYSDNCWECHAVICISCSEELGHSCWKHYQEKAKQQGSQSESKQ